MDITNPVPFDVIAPELLPGETVEWTGRPNPRVMFHREDWLMIPFSLLWGGFAIFWILGASGIWDVWTNKPSRGFAWFGVIWGTPFVLIGQYMIWGHFFYTRWKKGRTYYALTNRRALIIEQGLGGRKVSRAHSESLSMIDKYFRNDGMGSISFGGPVTGEWRSGRNNPPRQPTFDDVEGADSVYQIAVRQQELARKSLVGASRWPS